MNQLVKNLNTVNLTMTSREIADLVDSRHDKVKQSIERLAERGAITLPPLGEKPTAGRPVSEYIFTGEKGKRDSIIVVAQLSPEFTARLVDRWQELESQSAFQIPQTLSSALQLAADQAKQIEDQQLLIQNQQPAVEFVERFVETRSSKSLREVAKVLGVKEREFIARMIDENILFRQSGNIMPFATYQHKGYFTVKTGESNGHAFQQTRFTPEGLNWISKRFGLISGGCAA